MDDPGAPAAGPGPSSLPAQSAGSSVRRAALTREQRRERWVLDRELGPAGSPTGAGDPAGRVGAASGVLEELERLAVGLETAAFTVVESGYEPLEVRHLIRETIEGLRRLRLPAPPDPDADVALWSPRLLRIEAEAEALLDAARAEAEDLLRQARAEAGRLTEEAAREAVSVLADAQAEGRAAVLQGIREASALLARARSGAGEGRTADAGAPDGGAPRV